MITKEQNEEYLDEITHGDCRDHISRLADNSIELFLSDIPYGISLDDWDVLHDNTNSAHRSSFSAHAAPYTASSMLLKTAVSSSRTCSLGRKNRRIIERKG